MQVFAYVKYKIRMLYNNIRMILMCIFDVSFSLEQNFSLGKLNFTFSWSGAVKLVRYRSKKMTNPGRKHVSRWKNVVVFWIRSDFWKVSEEEEATTGQVKLTQMHVYWSQQLNWYFNKRTKSNKYCMNITANRRKPPHSMRLGLCLGDIISHSTN